MTPKPWVSPTRPKELLRSRASSGASSGAGVVGWGLRGIHSSRMGNYISSIFIPIGSMYGIFTYISLKSMVNVGKYTIDGWYGIFMYIPRLPNTLFLDVFGAQNHTKTVVCSFIECPTSYVISYSEGGFCSCCRGI